MATPHSNTDNQEDTESVDEPEDKQTAWKEKNSFKHKILHSKALRRVTGGRKLGSGGLNLSSSSVSVTSTSTNTMPAQSQQPAANRKDKQLSKQHQQPEPSAIPPAPESDNSPESILAKALRFGVIKMKITKLLISGAGATGKSSLIAMLLGENPVRRHNSTLLSRPVRHARFTAEGDSSQKWECVDNPADLEELLAGGIKNLPTKEPLEQTHISPLSSFSSLPNVEAAYSTSKTFASLVPRVKRAVKSKSLQTVHWIYTIDSGGQPAFQDILPAFIRGNSVNIHTLKLCDSLTDRIKMVFSIDGHMCESEDLCMTSLQLIKTLVRSSTSSHFLTDGAKKAKPHCIVVGTFYDKIGKSTEHLQKINHQLQDNLQYCDDVLVPSEHGIIFPVDTTVEGEEREDKASELREMIIDQTSVERDIPVKWFTFELELRKQKNEQGILSMDECIQVGKMFEMDGTEVKECIKYLHEQTLLLYFEKPLPNTVFIYAQTILDKVSAIIFVSLLNYKTRQLRRAVRKLPNDNSDVKNLRSQGRFYRKLLDCLPDVLSCALSKEQSVLFPDVFTADDFLALLEHLLVIAKLPEEGQYFIPCVLPTGPPHEQQKKDFSKKADPLYICWEDMPIPLGLFPALVVQLMRRESGQEFRLPREQQQLRNAICLDCPSLSGAILLVDSIDWMEVYYSGENSQCSQIHQAIIDGISTVVKTFGYQDELSKPRQGFCCQVLCCDCTHKHLCFVPTRQDRPTSVTCSRNLQTKKCSPQQLCWFGSNLTTTEPSDQDLMNDVASKIPSLWHRFGTQLSIPEGSLKAIRENTDKDCFLQVFQIWKSSLSRLPICWSTVLDVLDSEDIAEHGLARELRSKYCV